jgi:hypothetical protein
MTFPSLVLPSFRASGGRPSSAAVVVLAAALTAQPVAAADPIGRLFTTPQQRQKLNDLRRAELENPEPTLGPSVISADTPTQTRDTPHNPITVRGLVTREGGRSTAFINESNSYEGDIASEYIRVRSGDIEGGEVKLVTPYGEGAVALKVGQTLEPSTGRVIDLGEDAAEGTEPAAPPRDQDEDAPSARPPPSE